MRKVSVSLMFVALLLTAPVLERIARAEQPDPNKVQERLEFLTMWKMMEALDLDQPTAEKILKIRKKFLAQRKELRASIHEDFSNLKKILRDTPRGQENEKQLSDMLADIRDKRKRLQALDDELYNEVSNVLTVRQRAELIVFLKDFRKEVRDLLHPPSRPPINPPPFGPGLVPRAPRGDRPGSPNPGGPPGKWRNFDNTY